MIVMILQSTIDFIHKKYGVKPEYLWRRYPTFCVFRHADNNKWFALCATLSRDVLKISGDGDVDIINVKTDNAEFLRGVPGILPAYHMNKNNWVTVLLDGTVPIGNVKKLIEMSYNATK
ncbi:MAG: MmcQ/YjbR family DNA-binding protein [Alphaproteobacteria bacterium]|nr:MmcQ/YjbR family DNA-binding protein [Alphaproteobacteria bacterium]